MVDEEAAIFARYLVGRAAPPAVVARYRDATARLFPEPPSPRDRALLAFVVRHPWSAGGLDAAAALVAPTSQLRQRLLLMAALLETTPEGADEFLPREPGRGELAWRLPAIGLTAAGRLLLGLALYPIAARA
ncbi:MAG TPA: hypothetical protein VNO26_09970 [Candidatus Limnocylindria bacterium]|nr:hypothetical protein [Candidatus Limnocylindria bacterium]